MKLDERLLEFGARCVRLGTGLGKSAPGRVVASQLLRSATSCGANYEEACGAESKADFIHKMQVVLKEARESRYWLRLISHAQLVPAQRVASLTQEAEALARIIGKSVVTAKGERP
jgi:four helix bundle protein